MQKAQPIEGMGEEEPEEPRYVPQVARVTCCGVGARSWPPSGSGAIPWQCRSATVVASMLQGCCKGVAKVFQGCWSVPPSRSRPGPRPSTGAVPPASIGASRKARVIIIDCGRSAKVTRIRRISDSQASPTSCLARSRDGGPAHVRPSPGVLPKSSGGRARLSERAAWG
jgi:hypothetical protein